MSRFVLGNCLEVLSTYPDEAIDFVLTDPPYLVNYQDRTGRSIANDKTGEWLEPAFSECFRLLKPDSFCVSFYGWNRVDEFFHAWKKAGFRVVGHLVFTKNYVSKTGSHGSQVLFASTMNKTNTPEFDTTLPKFPDFRPAQSITAGLFAFGT